MLNLEELRGIAATNPGGDYYVSLYLNVDPITNPNGEYIIKVRNMLKETAEGLERQKPVFKKVKEDLELLEDYFTGQKPQFRKAICLITRKSGGFWKEYHLAMPVQSGIFVDTMPYLKPLFDLMDHYPRHLILLLSKDEARMFVVQMGEILEYGEVRTPDVIGKHKKGGWFALEQDRFERHTDFHVGLHLNEVVRQLSGFVEKQGISRIVIGGPQETLAMGREKLPSGLAGRIIGEFQAGMYETSRQILDRVQPIVSAYEGGRQNETVDELVTRAHKNNQAVLGIEDVMLMSGEKKIMTLLVDPALKQDGYACRNCGALALGPQNCRWCGGGMYGVNYLIDLLMQKTVENGGRVEVVPENEKLRNLGKIGAILRY